ncbi:MAG: 50S ribosomal protein L11 methyltransferase [Peptoniphilaceae bacterium]|nr:50S ribosomal protein L11 methyltransferase [Peptoniphilaceae bacterium]MDY6085427.1 50S ribosomal protein L11 methyltransferase [Peptoniphilaceae bacterium]
METDFLQLTIAYARDREDAVDAVLVDSGMLGAEVVDHSLIDAYEAHHPEWELADHEALEAQLAKSASAPLDASEQLQHVYFPATPEGEAERRALSETLASMDIRVLQEQQVDNAHWGDSWKQYYQPLPIGQTIEVVPAWMAPTAPSREALFIDPGMAFGTGSHETTALCLEALERLDLTGKRGLDLGTGSGILAIFMKRRGMARVLATDIDRDAIRALEHNAALNHVTIEGRESDLMDEVDGVFDVMTANLLAPLILRLIPTMGEHLAAAAHLIFSGLLHEHVPAVREALERQGYAVLDVHRQGEWAVVEAERSDHAHL